MTNRKEAKTKQIAIPFGLVGLVALQIIFGCGTDQFGLPKWRREPNYKKDKHSLVNPSVPRTSILHYYN